MKKLSLLLTLSGVLFLFNSGAQTFSLVKDIFSGDESSLPFLLTNVNGILFFKATDGIHGIELWKTNGTESGTVIVKDITSSGSTINATDPFYLTPVNNVLYFVAKDDIHGTELWTTDGTETGTVMVKDINTTATQFSNPLYLTNVNGFLYFRATDGINGSELWKTDGTELGTVMVKDIAPGALSSNPGELAVLNGVIYFYATDGINGYELWKSDGTELGTVMVKDIAPGDASSSPLYLINVNGTIYFMADDGEQGQELWKTDGTTAGTQLVKDITPGPSRSSGLTERIIFNDVLYFTVDDGSHGSELWMTNGTEAGTIMVKDINPGSDGSFAGSLNSLNGLLYFRANDGVHGVELWKSDGTAIGTAMVKDITPFSSFDPVGPLTKIGNLLYFSVDDGVHGREAWRSDGTTEGTRMLQDVLNPGSGDPNFFAEAGSRVFASFEGPGTGRELWAANIPTEIPVPLRLLEFNGSLVNNNVLLNWKTTNEENTLSFEIERSTDGRNYYIAGTVAAANTAGIHHYTFTDPVISSPASAVFYYRLKQKDNDGRFTYSVIVRLTVKEEVDFVQLYPNPVVNEMNCRITVSQSQKLQWRIVDNGGRILKQGEQQMPVGTTSFSVDIKGLPGGVYYFTIQSSSLKKQFQFVKQ